MTRERPVSASQIFTRAWSLRTGQVGLDAASCSSRCSSDGCVDVSVLSDAPEMAGAKKKAFMASVARRSRCGMADISPLIFCSAVPRAPGFMVRYAAARSATSSR